MRIKPIKYTHQSQQCSPNVTITIARVTIYCHDIINFDTLLTLGSRTT